MESSPNRPASKTLGHIVTAVVALAILLILLTYGRWEWLSNRYGTEMERVAVIEFEAAGLYNNTISKADDIAQIKVFSRGSETAELFLEDVQGNKWLMGLRRTPDGSNWTSHYDGGWHMELIHSAMGGPVQRSWYWY